MASGERINFFRNLRGMTQKYLGQRSGFPEKSADVRIAQYESETRNPKADALKALAKVLDVSPRAIAVPEIDTEVGLMHTLFVLEDRYGLKICENDGEMCLRLERKNNLEFHNMFSLLESWAKKAKELKLGKITKEEYDHWRYHYPDLETFGFTQHIPTGIDFEEEEDIPLSALLR